MPAARISIELKPVNMTSTPNYALKRARRLLLVAATYLGALVLVTPIVFAIVIFLAGPHAGLLPQALEVAVMITGWLAVLILPALVARAVWKKFERNVA
jgi:hypothetical protein